MAYLNKTQLIGRLTADPEAPRDLNGKGTVVTFRMAVGRSKKNAATGQWENDPNPLYIDVDAFGYADSKRNLANLVSQYAKQGNEVYVEGRLNLDQWEDKNGGGKRSKHKMVLENLEFLGGAKSSSDESTPSAAPSKGPAAAPAKKGPGRPAKAKAAVAAPDFSDDQTNAEDIPF